MWALLSPRLWFAIVVAVFLAGTHWKAYHSGYKARDAVAQVEAAQSLADALAESEKARKRYQEQAATINTVRGQYAKQTQNVHALAAASADGMRELQQALAGPAAAASSSATARADDASRARIVVGACAKTVQGLAALLDEREQLVIGLQAYITAIQPKP